MAVQLILRGHLIPLWLLNKRMELPPQRRLHLNRWLVRRQLFRQQLILGALRW